MALQTNAPSKAAIKTIDSANGGAIIDNKRPELTGTSDAGITIVVYDGARYLGTAVSNADGRWSFTPDTDLKAGKHQFTVIGTDGDGHYGVASDLFSITLSPAASTPILPPSITGLIDNFGGLDAVIPANGTTDNKQPVLSGTGKIGSVVNLYEDGSLIGSATVGNDGTWRVQPAQPLADGKHNIYVTQTDASSTSEPSPHVAFFIDTVTPPLLTLNALMDHSDHAIAPGDATADTQPHLSGTGSPGGIVTLYDGHTEIGSARVGADGNWLLIPQAPLADGTHNLHVVEINRIGSASTTSAQIVFSIDSTVPDALRIDLITQFGDDSIGQGALIPDSVIPFTRFWVSGTSTPGATVILFDGTTPFASVKASASGSWVFRIQDVAAGHHDFSVAQQNAVGTIGPHLDSIGFTIIDPTSTAPTISLIGIYDVNHVNAGLVSAGGVAGFPDLQIEGRADPRSVVQLFDGGEWIGSAVAGANGNWSFFSKGWSNGLHNVTATQQLADGTSSPHSVDFAFTVAYPGISAPVIFNATCDTGDDANFTLHIESGGTFAGSNVRLKGRSEADVVISIFDGDTLLGTTVSNRFGYWRFRPSVFNDGEHDLTAFLTNAAGVTSPRSAHYFVNIDTTGSSRPVILNVHANEGKHPGPVGYDTTTDDHRPTVSGTGTVGDVVTLWDFQTLLGSTTVDSTRHWSITPATPLPDGTRELIAKSALAKGTIQEASISFEIGITSGTPAPTFDRILAIDDIPKYYQGDVLIDSVTPWVNFSLSGRAENGSLITIYDGMRPVGSSVAGGGYWYVRVLGLPPGEHALYATQSNAFGEVSERSILWSFTIARGGLANTVTETSLTADELSAQGAGVNESIADMAVSKPVIGGKTRMLVPDAATEPKTGDTQQGGADSNQPEQYHSTPASVTTDHLFAFDKDPAVFFAVTGSSIQGGADKIDTVLLTGEHQTLDLTSLTGKTAAAKLSGVSIIDLGGHQNALKLSLIDVLNLAEPDLFLADGKQQMMIKGKLGDLVELSNAHVAGIADGQWEQKSTEQIKGASYAVYEHSSSHMELLVEQDVRLALHN